MKQIQHDYCKIYKTSIQVPILTGSEGDDMMRGLLMNDIQVHLLLKYPQFQ